MAVLTVRTLGVKKITRYLVEILVEGSVSAKVDAPCRHFVTSERYSDNFRLKP